MTDRIAFQGELGAYSHEACRDARPDMEALPCHTFEEVIDAVQSGRAKLAMLPVENTTYGRVADIHRLLPASGLRIVDEAFVRVHISLMALPGVKLEELKKVRAPAKKKLPTDPLAKLKRASLPCRRISDWKWTRKARTVFL